MSNPIVNRFLSHPLTFKPGRTSELDQSSLKTPSSPARGDYIILSASQQSPASKQKPSIDAHPAPSSPMRAKRPKSMAEAVAAYTGKRFSAAEPRSPKKSRLERIPTPSLEEVVASGGESEYESAEESVDAVHIHKLGEDSDSDSSTSESGVTESSDDKSEESGDSGEDLGELNEDLGEELDDMNGEAEISRSSPAPNLRTQQLIAEAGRDTLTSDSDDADFSKEPTPSSSDQSSISASPQSSSEDPDRDIEKLKHDLHEEAAQAQKTEKTPLAQEEASHKSAAAADLDQYYNFGEYPDDQGSSANPRIYKNWRELVGSHPVGLINHGVTCYMNTAIQALVHVPALQHYLHDVLAGCYPEIPAKSVSHTMAELSKRMWGSDGQRRPKYINPKKMIARLDDINCMMSVWQQEDSHEYLMSLMSRLQEDSTPKGHKLNESMVYDIFGGLLSQKITCLQCQNVSVTEQEMYDLSLGFNKKKSKYSVERSINEYFGTETIKADRSDPQSGYHCEKCSSRTQALKVSTIKQAPETLVVHLKRFKFDGNSSSKVKQSMKYSEYLDLSPFTIDNVPAKYRLTAVIVHEGRSLSSGHYIAHCLQPDGSWCTYDDEYINQIPTAVALADVGAYVLVYTKLTPKSSTTLTPSKKRPADPEMKKGKKKHKH
ncbi:ubiquitin carboxyl-terminal hydrolase 10 [Diutina catenulata]